MKLYCLLTVLLLFLAPALCAQQPRINQFVDISGTAGNAQGTVAASYVHNWHIGKKRRWEAGVGLRSTTYFGTKKDFITAPARLARSTTAPFVIVFAGQETQNWDTLIVQRPLINSVNISLNFGYNFSTKWSAGFNIDLIGVSFGRKGSGILNSNGSTRNEPMAKPYGFNALLTGDNDYGSLNSEYFIKYRVNSHWGLKAVYEYYFAEYQTSSIKQTAPDGTIVDRFRNKVNILGIGISYHFKK
jgi:hypothetical protein